MKKNVVNFTVLVGIALLVGFSFKDKTNIPQSFSAQLITDNTSSGASRTTTVELVYEDGILVQGSARYIVDTTLGDHIESSCIYKNTLWINEETNQSCSNLVHYPSTSEEFKNQVKNKEILPGGEACGRFDTCYVIR